MFRRKNKQQPIKDEDGIVKIRLDEVLYRESQRSLHDDRLTNDPMHCLYEQLKKDLQLIKAQFDNHPHKKQCWEVLKQTIQSNCDKTYNKYISEKAPNRITKNHTCEAINAFYQALITFYNNQCQSSSPIEWHIDDMEKPVSFSREYTEARDYLYKQSKRLRHNNLLGLFQTKKEVAMHKSCLQIQEECLREYEKILEGKILPNIDFHELEDGTYEPVYVCQIHVIRDDYREPTLTSNVIRYPYLPQEPSEILRTTHFIYPEKPLKHEIIATLKNTINNAANEEHKEHLLKIADQLGYEIDTLNTTSAAG